MAKNWLWTMFRSPLYRWYISTYSSSCLSWCFTSNLLIFLKRTTVSELTTILMIRGCTSLVDPQIIKIVNISETVGKRKKIKKNKSCLSRRFTSYLLIFFATINDFWVINDLDDQRMYIFSTSSDHQDR